MSIGGDGQATIEVRLFHQSHAGKVITGLQSGVAKGGLKNLLNQVAGHAPTTAMPNNNCFVLLEGQGADRTFENRFSH